MDPAPADRPVPAPAPATPPRPPEPSTAAPTAPPSAAPPAVRVLVHRLDPGLPLPSASHPDDAGTDLHAARDVHLAPGERTLVGTGIALALPSGYAGFVHPRSGLAARHGVTIVNAPGTVDAGYRGEVMVSLLNTDRAHAVDLPRGSRIAQLVVQRVERVELVEVTGVHELPASERGARGHGSTGTSGVRASDAGDRADSGVGPQRRPGAAPDAEAGGDAEAADGAARDDSGGRAERPAPAEETTW